MRIISIFLLMLSSNLVHSDSEQNKVISGWIENISITNVPIVVKAKLDTGAKTSSIYAVDIETFDKDGEDWVKFKLKLPNDNDEYQLFGMEKPIVRDVKIKNHNGKHDHRYVVYLEVCFNEQLKKTQFNLVDRSQYLYPVLLGRKFMKGSVIVDPEKTFLSSNKCN